jgi:hypothetical protein
VKPAAASAAARAESVNAVIRSHVLGPNYERLSSLTKLHILASDSSFDPEIFWMDDGKSFAINRVGYKHKIMNVLFTRASSNLFRIYCLVTDSRLCKLSMTTPVVPQMSSSFIPIFFSLGGTLTL